MDTTRDSTTRYSTTGDSTTAKWNKGVDKAKMSMHKEKKPSKINAKNEDEEEEYRVAEREIRHVPELATILASETYVIKDEKDSVGTSDVEVMHSQMLKDMRDKNFDASIVEATFESAFQIIQKQNATNNKSANRINKRELEMIDITNKYQKDTRVMKSLQLANKWRTEAEEAKLLVNNLRGEVDAYGDKNEMLTVKLDYNDSIILNLRKERAKEAVTKQQLDAACIAIQNLTLELKGCHMTEKEQTTAFGPAATTRNRASSVVPKSKRNTTEENSHTSLTFALRRQSDVLNRAQRKIEEYQMKRTWLHDKIAKEEKIVKDLNRKLTQQCKYIDDLEKTNDDMKLANVQLKFTLGSLKEKQAHMNRHLDHRMAFIRNTEHEFDLLNMNNKCVRAKLDDKQHELERTKKELGYTRNRKSISEAGHNDCTTLVQRLINEKGLLEQENRILNTNLQHKVTQTNKMRTLTDFQAHAVKNRDWIIEKHKSKSFKQNMFIQTLSKEIEGATHDIKGALKRNELLNNNVHGLRAQVIELLQLNIKQKYHTDRREKTINNLVNKMGKMDKESVQTRYKLKMCSRQNEIEATNTIYQVEVIHGLVSKLAYVDQEATTANFNFNKCVDMISKLDLTDRQQKSNLNQQSIEIQHLNDQVEAIVVKLRTCSMEVQSYMMWTNELYTDLKEENLLSKKYENQRNMFGVRVMQAQAKEKMMAMKRDEQDKVITQGRRDYNDRMKDIFVLKREISNMRRKNKIQINNLQNFEAVKQELQQRDKDLLLEKNKGRHMEEIKIDFHKNRKMQAIYPSNYDLMQKNQCLVKCVIRKSDAVTMKEMEIMQLIKDIMTLKVLLAKSDPGLDVKVFALRKDNTKKDRQIKSLVAEVRCVRYEQADQKRDLDHLSQDCAESNAKCVNKPKEPSKVRPAPRSTLPPIEQNKPNIHIVGGGFKFTTSGKHTQTSQPPPPKPLPGHKNDSLYIQSRTVTERNRNYNKGTDTVVLQRVTRSNSVTKDLCVGVSKVNITMSQTSKKPITLTAIKDRDTAHKANVKVHVNNTNACDHSSSGSHSSKGSNGRQDTDFIQSNKSKVYNINKVAPPKYNQRSTTLSSGERMSRTKTETQRRETKQTLLQNRTNGRALNTQSKNRNNSHLQTGAGVNRPNNRPKPKVTNTSRTTLKQNQTVEAKPNTIADEETAITTEALSKDGHSRPSALSRIKETVTRLGVNVDSEKKCSNLSGLKTSEENAAINDDYTHNMGLIEDITEYATKDNMTDDIKELAAFGIPILDTRDAIHNDQRAEDIEDEYLRDVGSDDDDTDCDETDGDHTDDTGTDDTGTDDDGTDGDAEEY